MALVSIVVPAFNEEEVLDALYSAVSSVIDGIGHDFEFVFVDDGSSDRTPEIIRALAGHDPRVRGLVLSRNFGHEAAIEAGLKASRGDAVIVMDADLQDGPEVLPELVSAWEQGAGVAYVVRRGRKESLPLRAAFSVFYRFAGKIMSIDLPRDAGPFSLMDRAVVDALNAMPEKGRYFPGLRAFAGFPQVGIKAERHERLAGDTKYSLVKRSLGASNAIFSFSKIPLRLMIAAAALMALFAIAGLVWVLVGVIIGSSTAQGWPSAMSIVFLVAAAIFFFMAILGEYVGKIYDEVRARPNFVVGEEIGTGD